MRGNEFISKVNALGKKNKVVVVLDAARGKGSHQTLYYGKALCWSSNLGHSNRFFRCRLMLESNG